MCSMPRVWNKYDPKCPPDAVYVGRGSPWGNPFSISAVQSREQVIERFRCETLPKLDVRPLRGKSLVCYCAPRPCHADLLLEAANAANGENAERTDE
jgi:hypothetical protein